MLNILTYLIYLTHLYTPQDQTISHLNLLLPLSKSQKITHTLSAYNGCYKWLSSNPKILSITPLKTSPSGCTSEITVKVETKENYENIIWISAEDLTTNEILNCEARVAPLSKLDIVTKQKNILVGDFETLELIGYDSEGNGFTSLEGLVFNWKIEQSERLAEFLSFRESLVKTSEKRQVIEDTGERSDMVILRGVDTGAVRVVVNFDEQGYRNVFGKDDLFIIEHFVVFPENTVFLIAGDKVRYSLFKIKKNFKKMELLEIRLPSDKYKWELSNDNVGVFRNSFLEVGSYAGSSYLTVYDVFNKNNKITNKVVVTEPRSLNLFINLYDDEIKKFLEGKKKNYFGRNLLDHTQFSNNWNLILGEEYIIKGVLFDEEGNEITIQKFLITFKLDSYFRILKKENNYIIVKAIILNEKEKIEAEFKTHAPKNIYKNIFKQYSILSKLKIIKPKKNKILLPYNPSKNFSKQQIFKLKTLGGSKKIKYISKNEKIATINPSGIITAKNIGKTQIECIDIKNKKNKDFIEIEIAEIKNIDFLEKKKEGKLFKENNLFIRAFDSKGRFFSNCTSLDYDLKKEGLGDFEIERDFEKVGDSVDLFFKGYGFEFREFDGREDFDKNDYLDYVENDFILEEDLEIMMKKFRTFGICSFVKVFLKESGVFNLEVQFADKLPKFSEFTIVEEYKVEFPEKYDENVFGKEVMLLPGTSVSFKLKGGPQGWNNNHLVDHRIYQNEKSKKYFQAQIIEKNNNIYVEIKCDGNKNYEKLQKGEIEIISSNKKVQDLISPVSIIAKINIICGNPSEVQIISKDDLKSKGFKSLKTKKPNFSFRNNRDHNILIWAYAKNGNPFWNITSLNSEITLQNEKIGSIQNPSKNEYKLNLNNNSGNSNLNLKIKGYKNSNFDFEDLKDSIQISSFDVLALEPKFNVLYLHPENSIVLNIINGSGNFEISSDKDYLAKIDYFSDKREIVVRPLSEGKVRVQVDDRNLSSSDAHAEIVIVKIDKILLSFKEDMVLLGESAEGDIQIFSGDEEIPKDQMKFINLEVFSSNQNVHIDLKKNKVILKPTEIGTYIISINSKIDKFTSNLVELNVFGNINVFPKNIYLTKGCKTTFKILGGPSSTLRQKNNYEIIIKDIAQYPNIKKIDENIYSYEAEKNYEGYLTIQLYSKTSKKPISQTKLFIQIKKITNFQIIVTNELWKGATTRIYTIPQIGQNPLTPSLCALKYSLTNTSPQTLKTNPTPPNPQTQKTLSTWAFTIKGLSPGRAILEISLTTKTEKKKSKFEINVINRTPMQGSVLGENCDCCGGSIVIPPSSFLALEIDNFFSFTEFAVRKVDGVVVLRDGGLESGEKLGVDVVVVRKNGALESVRSVLVGRPGFLVVRDSGKLGFVDVFSSFSLRVLFLDKFGRVFSNARNDFDVQFVVSNPEVVSLFFDRNSNDLVVNTKAKGTSVIHVQSMKYPHLFDVFVIRVGPMIKPEGNLNIHVGSTIKFEALREMDHSWQTTDLNVLDIDKNGLATGVNVGSAQIQFLDSILPSSKITISEITDLRGYHTNPEKLTNIKNKNQHLFLFEPYFKDKKLNFTTHSFINHNLNIICEIDNDDFLTKPYLLENNLLGCHIKFKEIPKRINKNILLTIKVKSQKNKNFHFQKSLNIQINQKIFQKGEKVTQIYLNKSKTEKTIKINSLSELEIQTSPKLTEFITSEFDAKKLLTKIKIKIPESENEMIKEKIILICKSTGEKKIIGFTYEPDSSFLSWFNFSNFSLFDFIAIFICFVISFFVFKELMSRKKGEEKGEYYQNRDVSASRFSRDRSFNRSYRDRTGGY